MNIVCNGEKRKIESENVGAALVELGYDEAIVATAVNGEFVPISARSQTPLVDNDRLEVLAPMAGG